MLVKVLKGMCVGALSICTVLPVLAQDHMVWKSDGNKSYWYENGVKQGTLDDPKGVEGYGTIRGREIYYHGTNVSFGNDSSAGWYWLDACYDGAKATSKEVWLPYVYQDEESGSTEGKWVRYDHVGRMYKGWYNVFAQSVKYYPDQFGNRYYYDPITGAMSKGWRMIDGTAYHFNEHTGVLDADDSWKEIYRNLYLAKRKAIQNAPGDEEVLLTGAIMYCDCDAVPELMLEQRTAQGLQECAVYAIRDGKAVMLLDLVNDLAKGEVQSYEIINPDATNRFVIQLFSHDTHYYDYQCHIEGDTLIVDHTGSSDTIDTFVNAEFDGIAVSGQEYLDLMYGGNKQSWDGKIGNTLDFLMKTTETDAIQPGRFETDSPDSHVIIDFYPDHTSKVMFCSKTDFNVVHRQDEGIWRMFNSTSTDETTNFIYDSASQLSYEVIDENTLDYMHYIYQRTATYE